MRTLALVFGGVLAGVIAGVCGHALRVAISRAGRFRMLIGAGKQFRWLLPLVVLPGALTGIPVALSELNVTLLWWLGLGVCAGYIESYLAELMIRRDAEARERTRAEFQELCPRTAAIHLSFEDSIVDLRSGEYDDRAVGLLFATTREAAEQNSSDWFTGERSDRLSFGRAFVRVPDDHGFGKLELPMKIKAFGFTVYETRRDPRKHFVLRTVKAMEEEEWCRLIARLPPDEALVFVHGFNTSFDEGLFRLAQIVWDLQFRGVSVLFSWPSRGGVLNYLYDRDSALGARDAFIKVLTLLKRQSNVKRVHVLAHSMGNLVVLDALAQHPHRSEPLNLGELILAAPDVDRDQFRNIVSKLAGAAAGMTLYASSIDRALLASKRAAGAIPRAGDVPAGGPLVIAGLDSIDVTAIGDEMFGFRHTTFATTRSIVNDIGLLIRTGRRPPPTRLSEIRGMPEGASPPTYWRYVP